MMIKRGKAEKWAARGERLSEALRQNLKRRKAQARARDGERDKERNVAGTPAAGESPAGDADGTAPVPDFRRNPGGE